MKATVKGLMAVALLAVARLATAGDAPASREPTRIPAEPLEQALRTLASERGFQVVYVSAQLDHRRTRGASGDLTVGEALTQVLRGSGLTFHEMSGGGVVIEPIASQNDSATAHGREVAAARPKALPSDGSFPDASPAQLGRVTVEASKDRQALRRRVDQFVGAVVVRPYDESLVRWNAPVCPLVAGLSKDVGEFILRRISQAAIDARVPLAGRACHPNLYVVATDQPDLLLKKWWARDRSMYETARGVHPVYSFLQSRRPIRVWYNTYTGCTGVTQDGPGISPSALTGFGRPGFAPPNCASDAGGASHLSYPIVQSIVSAIIVVDFHQMKDVTIRQMADYVALVGLADVRQDPGPTPAPSILRLFGHATPPPRELSPWDRALLYSLYNTRQSDRLQVPEIELSMVRRIAP